MPKNHSVQHNDSDIVSCASAGIATVVGAYKTYLTFLVIVESLTMKGCVVTIDAMGTQKEIAEKVIEKGADYILQVKGNHETLLEDISLYFEKEVFLRKKKELEKEGRYSKEMDFDHGRQEIREYYVENEIDWLKENHPGWKGLNGFGACVSTITENGVTTTAISYSIYSQEGLEAKGYGKERRSHWGIENSLHWILDIGFREDESRIRAGNATENVNVLRHIGTNLLKQEKSCRMGIASKRKKCSYDPKYLYKVLRGLNTGIE